MIPSPRGLAAAALLVAASCPTAIAAPTPTPAAAHPGTFVVDNAWFTTMPNNGPTYGYFRITNNSNDPRLLTGYDSPACGGLKLEEAHGGGVNGKAPVSMTIAGKTKLVFSRGGYHLVCEHLKQPLSPGQTIPVTITLDNGAKLQSPFGVRPPMH